MQHLKTANLYHPAVSVGWEVGSSSAGRSWLRVSHKVAVELWAGAVSSEGSTGAGGSAPQGTPGFCRAGDQESEGGGCRASWDQVPESTHRVFCHLLDIRSRSSSPARTQGLDPDATFLWTCFQSATGGSFGEDRDGSTAAGVSRPLFSRPSVGDTQARQLEEQEGKNPKPWRPRDSPGCCCAEPGSVGGPGRLPLAKPAQNREELNTRAHGVHHTPREL